MAFKVSERVRRCLLSIDDKIVNAGDMIVPDT